MELDDGEKVCRGNGNMTMLLLCNTLIDRGGIVASREHFVIE